MASDHSRSPQKAKPGKSELYPTPAYAEPCLPTDVRHLGTTLSPMQSVANPVKVL